MKTCFACQASIPDEYQYCLNCGRLFGDDAAGVQQEPPPTIPYYERQTSPNPQPTSARPSRLPWLLVLLFGMTIVALAIFIGLQRRTSSESNASTQASPVTAQQSSNSEATIPAAAAPTPATPSGVSAKPKNESSASNVNTSSTPDPNRIYTGSEVSTKARLISKPEPSYTEEARTNQITGTVVLKVVFSASGEVTNIRVVSGLPLGLTERAVAAARQIRFTPATKDGVPVSMWMQLEYNFNLY